MKISAEHGKTTEGRWLSGANRWIQAYVEGDCCSALCLFSCLHIAQRLSLCLSGWLAGRLPGAAFVFLFSSQKNLSPTPTDTHTRTKQQICSQIIVCEPNMVQPILLSFLWLPCVRVSNTFQTNCPDTGFSQHRKNSPSFAEGTPDWHSTGSFCRARVRAILGRWHLVKKKLKKTSRYWLTQFQWTSNGIRCLKKEANYNKLLQIISRDWGYSQYRVTPPWP